MMLESKGKTMAELIVFSEIRCGIDSFFLYICIHIKVLTLCNFYFWIVALCRLFAE